MKLNDTQQESLNRRLRPVSYQKLISVAAMVAGELLPTFQKEMPGQEAPQKCWEAIQGASKENRPLTKDEYKLIYGLANCLGTGNYKVFYIILALQKLMESLGNFYDDIPKAFQLVVESIQNCISAADSKTAKKIIDSVYEL